MARPELPSKFIDIATALVTRGPVSVIGVVVDVWGGAFRSQGTSVCLTFTIKDSNLGNGHTWDGLKIKYFKDAESLLPPVGEGDVILLRGLWLKVFNGRPLAVAAEDKTIPWAVFRQDRDPTSHLPALTGPVPFEPSYAEKAYALSLLETIPATFRNVSAARPALAQSTTSKPTSTATGKFALLKDVEERQFVDLVGEVVKIHGGDMDKATLYLTDYTTNENFYRYASDSDDNDDGYGREGDPHSYLPRKKRRWNGPSGQMTIQITLWEPHAAFAREKLSENDIIRLKNVRIKGSRVNGTLEGIIHTNRDNPRGVNIFPMNANSDVRVQQLLSRKTEYWEANPKKRKAEEDLNNHSKKSKVKKQQTKADPKKEVGQTSLQLNRRNAVNRSIRANEPGVDTRSLEAIINNPCHNNKSPDGIEYRLPFQNLCYRSTVRVVDFFPPRLEDFAVPKEHNHPDHLGIGNSRPFTTWQWRFCLLVESASPPPPGQPKERVKLFVSDVDAVYLLRLDADNLRTNPHKLSQIREKLFILWGDLEERKREALEMENTSLHPPDLSSVSSVPFECCIKEYGVRCSHPALGLNIPGGDDDLPMCSDEGCFGWERRFGLFSTVIQH